MRSVPLRGAPGGRLPACGVGLLWLLFWGGASVAFALVCAQLVGGLTAQQGGSSGSHDVAAIMTFQLVQVGYPLVSLADLLERRRVRLLPAADDEQRARLKEANALDVRLFDVAKRRSARITGALRAEAKDRKSSQPQSWKQWFDTSTTPWSLSWWACRLSGRSSTVTTAPRTHQQL